MKKKTLYWHHKKFKRAFIGHYEREKGGDRIFTLTGFDNKLSTKRKTFESWQAAKHEGWYKA